MDGRRRIPALLLLGVITVIMLCACTVGKRSETVNPKKKTDQETIEEMKRYFSKRYGDVSYQIEGFLRSGWDGPDDTLNCCTEIDGRREPFEILRTVGEDGSVSFADSYLGILLRDDFAQLVKQDAMESFSDCRVFVLIQQPFSQTWPANSQVSELIAQKAFLNVEIMVFVSTAVCGQGEFPARAEELTSRWGERGISSYIRTLLVDPETYGQTDMNAFSENWESRCVSDYHRLIG